MDPIVQSALISAAATILSVGATAAVAIVGFRMSRSASDKTVAVARDTNQATIDAAHADVRRTLDATRDGQLADRYTKAIEQLGSTTVDVTIGGIYALERIAYDSPKDHPTVMEVLAACVREHSAEPMHEPMAGPGESERATRPDIQAAVTVIGRRDTTHDRRPINLRRVNLPNADLPDVKFSGVDLADANLRGADLTNADLTSAHLGGADLTSAHLASAHLRRADLTSTRLRNVDLTGADLGCAHLPQADLPGAALHSADLAGADLAATNLVLAHLTNANLTGANLASADLTGADLTGADLTGADLTAVNLTGADLEDAKWPTQAPLPEGWELDMGSGRLRRRDVGPVE